jgi:hypothetical protein
MHPLFARPSRLFFYLVAWAFFGLLLALVFAGSRLAAFPAAAVFTVPLTLIYALVCLSAWWVCRAYPLAPTPPWRVALVQLGAAASAAAAWVLLGAAWMVILARLRGLAPAVSEMTIRRDLAILFAAGVLLYLLSAVLHYLLAAVAASHAAERRALESQVHAREAELRALRAQLNPHFLFNSLNSINALVGRDPEGARRMCEGLGDFLRLTLHLGGREVVTLSEELALVDRYLAIEQVRFGERLQVERRVDPEALSCLLAPLLLQPLVENAVKHGVAGRSEGGTVCLEASLRDGRMIVALENSVDEEDVARPGTGTGLENVRRRLSVLAGRDGQLQITRRPGVFRAVLDLAARQGEHGEDRHA